MPASRHLLISTWRSSTSESVPIGSWIGLGKASRNSDGGTAAPSGAERPSRRPGKGKPSSRSRSGRSANSRGESEWTSPSESTA
eukprot:3595400-Alexandrium_andersonii.AAC.1